MRLNRLSTAIVVSVAAHAALFIIIIGGYHFPWPAPPIPIELRPAQMARTPAPSASPQLPATPSSAKTRAGAGKPKPVAVKPAGKPGPLPTEDLKPFAPSEAHLVVLLRCDKLRQSPHRAIAEKLLSAFPDYQRLIAGSDVNPIEHFNALLIATANPFDVTATFLAAKYSEQPRVAALQDRALPAGDPRVFRQLGKDLLVLTRPDGAALIDQGPTDLGDARSDWLRQLEQFDKVARDPGGPALLVTFNDVPVLLRFGAQLPTPQALALSLTAEASPRARLKAVFANAEDAHRFADRWPEVMRRYRDMTLLFGISALLDELKLTRKEAELELMGPLPEAQMRTVLTLARAFLPATTPGAPFDLGGETR